MSTETDMESLSPEQARTGIKAALAIAEKWQLTDPDLRALLGDVSESALSQLNRSGFPGGSWV